MKESYKTRVRHLGRLLCGLSHFQFSRIEQLCEMFLKSPVKIHDNKTGLFPSKVLKDFGDILRFHHCFSAEPFSKDKFEYGLEQVCLGAGIKAHLAKKGNRGHDITIGKTRFSLKTQADSNLKFDKIWISKFMELGGGNWSNKPSDLKGLRNQFLKHLKGYERILVLRVLSKDPSWMYELVEIPKRLFSLAKQGDLSMKMNSEQLPKPGYCYVRSAQGELFYSLYFDGGGERKLQVKNLLKSQCVVHASWEFRVS